MRLAACLVLCCGALFAADPIGTVTAIDGSANAQLGSENVRPLKKDSPVYEGDAVFVDSRSKTQLGLIDGSVLVLIENTEFHFDTFRYGKLMSNRSSSTLAKGGFRLLAGNIATGDPDKYSVKSPAATVGIRGTSVDAVFVDGELHCGVLEGECTVSNSKGEITLCKGQYATAKSDLLPQRLSTIPTSMLQRNFTPIQAIRAAPPKVPIHPPPHADPPHHH